MSDKLALNIGYLTSDKSAKADESYTPYYAVEPILKYLPKDKIIWSPCDAEWSAFYRSLKMGGYQVVRSCIEEGQDFFTYQPDKWDIIVTNPPFSIYIAFILPISQLNNTHSMYEFDLIYSEDLDKHTYTDRELHCCFNIYRRPVQGELNKKPTAKLKDISIYRQDSKGYADKEFDIRMCHWGDGTAGKILKDGENYSAEYKIKIHNEDMKSEIIEYLSNFDWRGYLNCIAMRKIQQFHIIDVLKSQFPNLK